MEAATEKSDKLGIKINAAVTDNGGHLLAFLRMPGAFLHSVDIAIDKAYTAISFGFPTSEWDGILPPGSTLQEGIQTRDRLVSFGGGIPIIVDGQCIGGIGVSGGSEEEDAICAQAGIDAIS
ncbi:MAG: cobalamin adenosyltransferase [Cycloclasticus sp. symbiont of Poecilosclerida sp. M]|nr:MAG: cobalamin adenosyltransferase [Cycloclasticus sp. symbiont of Poecilosclerida sp. M]